MDNSLEEIEASKDLLKHFQEDASSLQCQEEYFGYKYIPDDQLNPEQREHKNWIATEKALAYRNVKEEIAKLQTLKNNAQIFNAQFSDAQVTTLKRSVSEVQDSITNCDNKRSNN